MSKTPVNPFRRRLLVGSVAAVVGATLGRNMLTKPAHAADLPRVEEDSPTAKALKYYHDASKAPRAAKSGTPADQQFCKNCQLIRW